MKKILVLDDDSAVLEAVEATLTYCCFEVKTIATSTEIFNVISEFHPDILIMDYVLSGKNGGQICEEIKTTPETKNLPVVLISAYPKVQQTLGGFGSDAIIAKPFNLSDLLDTINLYVNK